jgi:MFS family permease
MTYGLYAREWHLTNTVTAGNFAIDPLAVVVMLVGFGGISDQIGHRATMLAGLFASLVGALLFAVAPNVCWVFAGRALMGIGVGLAASPSTAAILEFTSRNKSAASVTMGAEVMGFTAALLISWIARSESVISAAFRCRRAAVAVLAIWHRTLGTVSISSIHSKPAEAFYWITILFSQTLGTALGDGMADSTGLGYAGGARFRLRARDHCRGLWVDQRLAHGAVLDCFRAHPADRRHTGRFPRQAVRPWRPGA